MLNAVSALADGWVTERAERFQRRHLEFDDFEALAATGFLRLVVPEAYGGHWRSLAETGPIIIDAIYRLARGDQSVALVASMHPTIVALWAAGGEVPPEFAELWSAQQNAVFQSVLDGNFWGTLASEPGSGGDVMRTKAIARPIAGSASRSTMHGAKHFGSGSEMLTYMITTAKPEGSEEPGLFYLDLRNQPWDGSAGVEITRRWDGMGMKATQSHAIMLDGVEGVAYAWPGALAEAALPASTLGLTLFSAVTLAVVDAAMEEATSRLQGKSLRAYEDVAWTEAQIQHWIMTQAQRGIIESLANETIADAAPAAIKAKMGMANIAEATMTQLCRAVGGGAYSASSPFATWNEDVRALGFLRPPWGLAFDQLIEARHPAET